MADQEFKHISIEDDDDEVIVVGARAVEPDLVPDFIDDPVPEAPAAPKVTASAAPSNELDVPPMSALQKIIIGAALVGVVILVAYLVLA